RTPGRTPRDGRAPRAASTCPRACWAGRTRSSARQGKRSSSGCAQEEFAVAVRAADRAVEPLVDAPAGLGRSVADPAAHELVQRRVAHDSVPVDAARTDLELRLDQREQAAAAPGQR